MRDYGKVSPQFWMGKTGKLLRSKGPEAQIVALYLMTSPHANMIGMYYCPLMYIAHETGLGIEGASKGLQGAIEADYCSYDEVAEVVWVHEMIRFQISDELKDTDKRCKGVQNEYDALPENLYLVPFFDKYADSFHLTNKRGVSADIESPIEGALKPLGSQEQEQEQEQDINTAPESEAGTPDDSAKRKSKPTVTLKTFMENCKANGESVIADYQPLLTYAGSVNLPEELLALCWQEFKSRYLPDGPSATKRYKDWRIVFLTAVKENWLKIWWVDPDGTFSLTTRGKQAEMAHREAA